ncbi:MAG TPA: polyprenyl synthetase family protein [Steroidobacteraceae bacterium]|nr:polyprenyl synthetase family protein [Steroidobacteraceae bacterium]
MAAEQPTLLDGIRGTVAADLAAVDATIRRELASDVALVNQVSEYIIGAGGKRLRPLLVLLAARAAGAPPLGPQVMAAVVIEFIHTATLLHDDVVDGSHQRRGRDTANEVWGNSASVLVGDFLYSRAFQMMVRLRSLRVMEIMADATNVIAEGEVLQLMNAHDPDTSESRYLDVIYRKTARLFESGAQIAAVLAGAEPAVERALADYGRHLGNAFQLVDDSLDYRGSPAERGKNVGDDLAEGKPTLPVIHALRCGSAEQQALLRRAIETGGLEELPAVLKAIESAGGLEYTARLAQGEADQALAALEPLPESVHGDALRQLAGFAISRSY